MSETTTPIGSRRRPRWLLPAAALATVFGIATIVAGGRVVFGSAAARAAEGDYVPFVLWFNFLAGFVYVAAGIALALARPWGARLAFAIAVGTALVYVAFGLHVLAGGAFTRHTVMAMTLRTLVWVAIAALACRHFGCRRSKRTVGGMFAMTVLLVGVTTCGRPSNTVKVHAPEASREPAGRPLAPRMAVKDHKERELELPVRGRVTVLSFASRSTADRGSERCREVRVAHPDVELVEFMNASGVPGILASKVKGKLADRHESIASDTTKAFAAANKTPPADLDERIHIVPDWSGDAFKAYGATNTDNEVQIAVIDGGGAIVSFFSATPTAAELSAAVARAHESSSR
jgi:hypothetical protein